MLWSIFFPSFSIICHQYIIVHHCINILMYMYVSLSKCTPQPGGTHAYIMYARIHLYMHTYLVLPSANVLDVHGISASVSLYLLKVCMYVWYVGTHVCYVCMYVHKRM
jgi:hypothetical protein